MLFHSIRNTACLAAYRSDKRAHIMDCADKNSSQNYPNTCRNPSEGKPGNYRASNRAGSGNRREVLSRKEFCVDRFIVQSIAHLDCRCHIFVVKHKNLFGHKLAVGKIGKQKD